MKLVNFKQVETHLADLQNEYPNAWVVKVDINTTFHEVTEVVFHSGEVGCKPWVKRFTKHEYDRSLSHEEFEANNIIFKY